MRMEIFIERSQNKRKHNTKKKINHKKMINVTPPFRSCSKRESYASTETSDPASGSFALPRLLRVAFVVHVRSGMNDDTDTLFAANGPGCCYRHHIRKDAYQMTSRFVCAATRPYREFVRAIVRKRECGRP